MKIGWSHSTFTILMHVYKYYSGHRAQKRLHFFLCPLRRFGNFEGFNLWRLRLSALMSSLRWHFVPFHSTVVRSSGRSAMFPLCTLLTVSCVYFVQFTVRWQFQQPPAHQTSRCLSDWWGTAFPKNYFRVRKLLQTCGWKYSQGANWANLNGWQRECPDLSYTLPCA